VTVPWKRERDDQRRTTLDDMKLLLVVVIIAVVVYLVTRAMQERGQVGPWRRPGAPRQQRPRPKPQPRRPVAPDDDDDFLRDLERKRRQGRDPEA
jgi:hypothetical protein